MSILAKYLRRIQLAQWILIGAGFAFGITAVILGVADNPPGITALYAAVFCLAAAWIWNFPAPRDYWIMFLIALAGFPVGVVLHNLFYGLGTLVTGVPVLKELIEFLHVIFFLAAVVAAGPAALASLIGGVVRSWQGMDRMTRKNRSIRRFKENLAIDEKKLRRLIKLAQQSASGANLQPLKFVLSCSKSRNEMIFSTLSWAGYLDDWDGPQEGERPSGYVILLGDTELAQNFQYDAGIAGQSITLGAVEKGLGACMIGSIDRDRLREALSLPDRYQILLVIALGVPAEDVVLGSVGESGEIQYWRDENDFHHVPKRGLDELILDL